MLDTLSPSKLPTFATLHPGFVFQSFCPQKSKNSFLSDSIDEDPEFGDTTIFYDWKECSTIISDETALNESIIITENLLQLSIPEIRRELQKYGEVPGPITPATKNVYLKRLTRLGSGTTYSKVINNTTFVCDCVI